MSLLRISRAALSNATAATRLAAPRAAVAASAPARSMANGSDKFKEKESSAEKDFVSRQERDALKRMLAKLEQQADPGQKKALADLETYFSANGIKMSEAMKKDLLEWKNKSH